jgi:hypothetical protein
MLRGAFLTSVVLASSVFSYSQIVLPKVPVPESAYVAKNQYTNAFFGFRVALPEKHFQITDLSESNKAWLHHFLFAERSFENGITLLAISATQVLGNPQEEAQKEVFLPGQQGSKGPEGMDIGGRLFWKNQSEQKTVSGKVYRLKYATGVLGYVLVFSVSSQSGRMADELRQDIESMKFFDPSTAKTVAGPDSQPYLTQGVRQRLESGPALDLAHVNSGSVSDHVYTNDFLGFSFDFPQAWHIGSTDSNLQVPENGAHTMTVISGTPPDKRQYSEQCMRLLSAATKYAPNDQREPFNPRIMLLAADPSCFAPDVKFPESVHDKETIQVFGQELVRAFAGTPFLGPHANRLFAADVSGHTFLEMPSGTAIPIAGSTLLRKVHSAFVMTELRRYWVIWLIESDTESELDDLMKNSFSFVPADKNADVH